MPFPNFIGSHKRYWTRERVIEGLQRAAQEIKGPLPCLDQEYSRIKKGHLDWPVSARVLFYFGAMARGWRAAGVEWERISLHNVPWVPEEDEYLKENAGTMTLEDIGRHLHRSYQSVRYRLNRCFGIKARDNEGYLSAAQMAKHFNCSCHRIRTALHDGRIRGTFDTVRNRWRVDIGELNEDELAILNQPKLKTHRTTPPDVGDYYQRYGIRRRLIDGKTVAVEEGVTN